MSATAPTYEKQIRSLHVVSSLRLSAGGPTQSVTQLCEALNRQGGIAEIATVHSPDAIRWNGNTPIRSFPGRFPDRLRRSPELAAYLMDCASRFDIIHLHGLWQWPGIYARRAAVAAGIPFVISPRGMVEPWGLQQGLIQKRLAWVCWERHNLSSAAMFHATSPQEATSLRSLGLRQPICVIPNSQDFPEGELNPGRIRRLLFLSRLHPKKGIENLLRTWRVLSREFENWELMVVGPADPNYKKSIEILFQELPRVSRLDPVYGMEKWLLLRTADLVVLPSYSENFGNVVAEALSQGVPVITTHGTPWQSLREKGVGWWVDLLELETALREAMNQPRSILQAMGARGRTWVLEALNPATNANQLINCYACVHSPATIRSDAFFD